MSEIKVKNYYLPEVTRRDIRVNTAHWNNISAGVYRTQPDINTVAECLRLVSRLNHAVKFSNCCIGKTGFYKIKSALIRWCLMQHRLCTRPDIEVFVDGVEEAPGSAGHAAVALTISLDRGDHRTMWQMHQILESPLRWIIWDKVYGAECSTFATTTTYVPMTEAEILSTWEELLTLLERHNWFVFDDVDVVTWLQIMTKRYPDCFTYQPGHFKLNVMLQGGPRITLPNGAVVRTGVLRSNFYDVMVANDLAGKFTLSPAKKK